MAGINMPDPDGVRAHGARFKETGADVHKITDRMNDMRMSESTLGGEWLEQGAAIRGALPRAQAPWRRLGDFNNQFGGDLRESADLVQGADQERADSLEGFEAPDGQL